MREFLSILGLSVLAAVAYGLVHDQVTARVCVEYFSVAHPPMFGYVRTDDPTLLALYWGVVATWWMGLLLGIPLAIAARAGKRPPRSARSLVRPVLVLLAIMALTALAAGIAGWLLARNGNVILVGRLAEEIPPGRHARFLADLWAHWASYLVGFFGGLVLVVLVRRSRRPSPSHSSAGDSSGTPSA